MSKRKTILLSNHYSDSPLRIVHEELPDGFDVVSLINLSKDELVQKAQYADYILASGRLHIDGEVISAANRLKMVQRTGVGTDTLDFDTLAERRIPVYVNQGVNSASVAEHTILLMLASLRQLSLVDKRLRAGIWEKNETGLKTRDLSGRIVGIIGMGCIGRRVAELLKAFGCNATYYDIKRLQGDGERELGVKFVSLNELLQKSDIITIHCSLNENSKGLIGEQELAIMKTGSIIINTARGSLIDESALYESLNNGHISFAGLDVFSDEPIRKDNPLKNLDNVILTPHIGGITQDSFRHMIMKAMSNIQLFEAGNFKAISPQLHPLSGWAGHR